MDDVSRAWQQLESFHGMSESQRIRASEDMLAKLEGWFCFTAEAEIVIMRSGERRAGGQAESAGSASW